MATIEKKNEDNALQIETTISMHGDYKINTQRNDLQQIYPYVIGTLSRIGIKQGNIVTFGPFSTLKIKQIDPTGRATWFGMASRLTMLPSGVAKNLLVALRTYPVHDGKRRIAVKGSRFMQGGGLGYLYYAMYLSRWGDVHLDLYDYGEVEHTNIIKYANARIVVNHIVGPLTDSDQYQVIIDDAWTLSQGPVPLERTDQIYSKKGIGEISFHDTERRTYSVSYRFSYEIPCRCPICNQQQGLYQTAQDYEWINDIVAMLTPGRSSCAHSEFDLDLWSKGQMIYDIHRESMVSAYADRRKRALLCVNQEYPLTLLPQGITLDYTEIVPSLVITDQSIKGPYKTKSHNPSLNGKNVSFHGVAAHTLGIFQSDKSGLLVEVYANYQQFIVTPPVSDEIWAPFHPGLQWDFVYEEYGSYQKYIRNIQVTLPKISNPCPANPLELPGFPAFILEVGLSSPDTVLVNNELFTINYEQKKWNHNTPSPSFNWSLWGVQPLMPENISATANKLIESRQLLSTKQVSMPKVDSEWRSTKNRKRCGQVPSLNSVKNQQKQKLQSIVNNDKG